MGKPHTVPPQIHAGHPAVVAPVRVDPAGQNGPTAKQARGPRWRRSSDGLYVPAYVDADSPAQRIVEAHAAIPGFGGVTGWAGLSWMGSAWHDGLDRDGTSLLPVPLAIGPGNLRPSSRWVPSKERLNPADLVTADGIVVTTAVRSTCFAIRHEVDLRRAVVHADMAAFADLLSADELAAYVAADVTGRTGVGRCRQVVGLMEENSWSPQEVLMPLVWRLDAGKTELLCNPPVFDTRGSHIGTPDLLDPVAGVVGEYDGGLHLQGDRRARDLEREELFRSHGLEYIAMVAAYWRDVGGYLRRLWGTYRRAERVPDCDRSWTLTTPAWWVGTETVPQRRALARHERARLLAHRAG